MTVTTVPDPQHPGADCRLSHEPPAAIAKRGWRYHHIRQENAMSSKMRSSDHVIVVSLLVGVIFLLILERGKGSLPGTSGTEKIARGTEGPG